VTLGSLRYRQDRLLARSLKQPCGVGPVAALRRVVDPVVLVALARLAEGAAHALPVRTMATLKLQELSVWLGRQGSYDDVVREAHRRQWLWLIRGGVAAAPAELELPPGSPIGCRARGADSDSARALFGFRA